MLNSIKRGFGYTLGRILFYIFVALIIGLLGYLLGVKPSQLLMDVHAEEKVYNYLDLDSSSSNRQYYATITKLPSEQYDNYNWYFWESELQLSERITLLVDYITSRSYSNINANDIQYIANCKAVFRGGQHLKENLDSYNNSYSACYFTFYISNNAHLYLRGMHPYASSWSSAMLNGNDRSNYINGGTNLNYFSCSQCKYVDFYYYFNSEFFTTPVEDLDTWLANNISLGNYFDKSGSGYSHSNTLGEGRITYNSINNWNSTKYPNYNYANFIYHAPSDIATIENYTYPSTLTGSNLTTCRIINGYSTCDNEFVFIDYETYKSNGGSINQNENGYPEVDLSGGGSSPDYTSNINAINSNITDPSIDTSDVDSLLSNSNFNENETIQNIVSLPIDFIENLSNTCSPIEFTIPWFNADVSIPCMSTAVYPKFGVFLAWSVGVVINGYLIYKILLKFVELFNDLKDPTKDKIEVVDL